MKNLFIAGLLLVISLPCFAKTGWEMDGLKGKVRQKTAEAFSVKMVFGKPELKSIGKMVAVYDNNGNKIEQAMYSTSGLLTNKYTFKYSKSGSDNTKEERFVYDGSMTLTAKTESVYDSKMELLQKTVYNAAGVIAERIVCVYENGKLSEKTTYDKEGLITGKTVYSYSESYASKVTEEALYNADGSLKSKVEYRNTPVIVVNGRAVRGRTVSWLNQESRYDANGYLVSHSTLREHGSSNIDNEYEFDSLGNAIKQVQHSVERECGRRDEDNPRVTIITKTEYIYF